MTIKQDADAVNDASNNDTEKVVALCDADLGAVEGGADGGDKLWYKIYRYLEGGSTGGNGFGRTKCTNGDRPWERPWS